MSTAWKDRMAVLAPFLKTKKIFVFGAGEGGANVFCALKDLGVPVAGFLDNKAEPGGQFQGVSVVSPAALQSEAVDKVVVMVASQMYAKPMEKQLEGLGLCKGVSFFSPMELSHAERAAAKAKSMGRLSEHTQKYEGEFTRIFRTRDPKRGVSVTLDENYTLYHGVLATRGLARWPRMIPVFRRSMDALRAIPEIFIALVLIFILGGGPVPAVIAVYARETGQGMALPEDPHPTADAPLDEGDIDVEEDAAPSLALVSSDDDDGPGDDGGPETPRPPRRGNHLRVVK